MISKDFLVSKNINPIIQKKVQFSSLSTYSHSIDCMDAAPSSCSSSKPT